MTEAIEGLSVGVAAGLTLVGGVGDGSKPLAMGEVPRLARRRRPLETAHGTAVVQLACAYCARDPIISHPISRYCARNVREAGTRIAQHQNLGSCDRVVYYRSGIVSCGRLPS